MAAVEQGTELVELFEKASKAADRASGDGGVVVPAEETRCTDALKSMGNIEVSTSLLLSTQVGKRLRKLTKHRSSKISASALELLEAWKKVVAGEAASKSGNGNGPSVSSTPSPKTESSSRTPPAMAVKKERVSHVKVETTSTVTSRVEVKKSVSAAAAATPKAAKVEPKHVSSVPASPAPSSSSGNGFVAKIGKIPKAGDSTRDRFRELLVEALAKVGGECNEEDLQKAEKADIVKAAVAVESALFAKLGLTKGKEKAKYRSIIFNIKDEKNPDFRRRVLFGEIKPEAILTMTSDDMASDQRKKENEDIKSKALFECERGLKDAASTDQFKCGKCGQRKTTYFQMQTRSADEPMTTFVTCVNCNAHWKFC